MSDTTLNDWQDYRNWCRLCGSFDATLTPDKEIQEIINEIIKVKKSKQKFKFLN